MARFVRPKLFSKGKWLWQTTALSNPDFWHLFKVCFLLSVLVLMFFLESFSFYEDLVWCVAVFISRSWSIFPRLPTCFEHLLIDVVISCYFSVKPLFLKFHFLCSREIVLGPIAMKHFSRFILSLWFFFLRWTTVVPRPLCGCLSVRGSPCPGPWRSESWRPALPGSSSQATTKTAACFASRSQFATVETSMFICCSLPRDAWDTVLKVSQFRWSNSMLFFEEQYLFEQYIFHSPVGFSCCKQ